MSKIVLLNSVRKSIDDVRERRRSGVSARSSSSSSQTNTSRVNQVSKRRRVTSNELVDQAEIDAQAVAGLNSIQATETSSPTRLQPQAIAAGPLSTRRVSRSAVARRSGKKPMFVNKRNVRMAKK